MTSQTRKKTSVLFWVAILLGLVALGFFLRPPAGGARPPVTSQPGAQSGAEGPGAVTVTLIKDPEPGEAAPARLAEALAKVAPAGKPVVLVVIGDCTDCALKYLKEWDKYAAEPGAPSILVLTPSLEEQLAAFRAKYPELKLPLLREPYDELDLELNVLFRPRVYLYGSELRLEHVQADGTDRDFDWKRIRKILAKTGFRGFLSVEYEGADADEVGTLRRIAKFLKKLR